MALFVKEARRVSPQPEQMVAVGRLARIGRSPSELAADGAVFDQRLEQDRRAQGPGRRYERRAKLAASLEVQLARATIQGAESEQMRVEGLVSKRPTRSRQLSTGQNPDALAQK